MTDRSFCRDFFRAFLVGGTYFSIVYTTLYLFDKIEKRFSRLEEKKKNMNLVKIN